MKRILTTIIMLLLCTTTATAGSNMNVQYQSAHTENDFSATAMGVPLVWHNNFGHNILGLNGDGQVVGVADNGLDVGQLGQLHPDLKNRIIGIKDYSGDGWDDPSGHGTHIVASIVGSGEMSGGQYQGIAPGAGLYFQATYEHATGQLKIPNVYDLLRDAYINAGVRVHSNSWGFNEIAGQYDSNAYSLDKFVWEHRDMVVLKSAGNDGAGSLVSSPGTAKNAITVGAVKNPRAKDEDSDNPEQVASFSSRGTADGRIKPDLVAPGTWVRSAYRSVEGEHQYEYLSGTSVATAMATGATALIRQYFTDIKEIAPSAALVKGALIHGAKELQGESRLAQGFGMIDVQGTLMALEDSATVYRDHMAIKGGEMYRFKLKSDGQTPLKVTLVWSDFPQHPGPYNALVNDLDLRITTPDGRELWGNNISNGDRKNNVEVITLNHPVAGEYLIDVRGTRITQGQQTFSIIYGHLPQRGVVRYNYPEGPYVENKSGQRWDISLDTSVKLVNNNQFFNDMTFRDLRSGADVYYYPASDGRKAPKLEAIYNMKYATMRDMLAVNQSVNYRDIDEHWAEQEIIRMSKGKIVQGWPDGSFHPDQPVTRAQFAAMLVRALKLVDDPVNAQRFADVPRDAWCRGAVGAAVAAGIVQGYSQHSFGPNDVITREQMAAMVARAVNSAELSPANEKLLEQFADAEDIGIWAQPAVTLMVEKNIFKGRTEENFEPRGTTTRAEATVVLLRMFNLL